jgi:hypothetical protein
MLIPQILSLQIGGPGGLAFVAPMPGQGASGGITDEARRREEFLNGILGMGGIGSSESGYVSFDAWSSGNPMVRSELRGPASKGVGQGLSPGGKVSSHQAIQQIANMPPAQVIKWKNAIYESGLYNPSYYSKGIKPRQNGLLDSEDISAFNELMYISLRAPVGTTVQDVLEQVGGDNPFSAKNNYGKEPRQGSVQQVSISDEATIRKYAKTAAQELLGRDLDDATMAKLVGKMQATEKSVGIADAGRIQAAQKAAEGGADQVVQTTQVNTAARTEEQILAENPGEAEAKSFANNMDAFFRMISGGS